MKIISSLSSKTSQSNFIIYILLKILILPKQSNLEIKLTIRRFLIVYIVQTKVFLSDVKLRRNNNCLKFGFENKCRSMQFFDVYENSFVHNSKKDSKWYKY